MVTLDYTILVQMANFILLIFILNVLLYKPILSIIGKRKSQMEESDSEVKRLSQTVEQKLAEYENKVRLAKLEAMEQRNAIVKEGTDRAKGIIDAVRNEIPAMMEQFNAKMGKEVDAARAILRSQSQKISLDIAEKVLGRSIQ
ncbi:MAG: ATP synthase F0 subunit B [Deltaproteobacteria bacterium]|jgi:F-type H+-transporting ATPase subunit b|nr:ATP synthase F0 subunit B [Deltaproteobacteria bacterium]